ncbi:CHAT domain-containing protein [candidate division KSB1 bacterium]|nr:CHAT domain-containing protein [candidate division KSB1 bacterium]
MWWINRPIQLLDLQKAMVVAKTDAEKKKILDKLDRYYLTMSIPDSIRRHVLAASDTLIQAQERNKPWHLIQAELDTNVYQVEVDLKAVLREAMIARIRDDDSLYTALMNYAKMMSDTVDIGTENDYWRNWVARVATFDKKKAMMWLEADRAERLCMNCLTKTNKYTEADYCCAFGLQLVLHVGDKRLDLDIRQRIQYILYDNRSMYNLSFSYAVREMYKAYNFKYYLRAIGISYNYSTALLLAGYNDQAHKTFLKTIKNIEKYNQIPMIYWYKNSCWLGVAKTTWLIGDIQNSISICSKIETQDIESKLRIDIHNTKGICYEILGNYDRAYEEYTKSLDVARTTNDIYNQIIVLHNIGTMYRRLTDYNLAVLYYNQAIELHHKFLKTNIDIKSRLLARLVETKIEEGKTESFNKFIREANYLLDYINFPIASARLLRIIGLMNMKMNNYTNAYSKFHQSEQKFSDYGMITESLESKRDLAECMIKLNKYNEAENLLNEMIHQANIIQDNQTIIDAYGLKAELAFETDHLDKAINISDEMICKIESINKLFSNIDNLTMFQQKVNNYLNDAIIYELKKGRTAYAFDKLEYMKTIIINRKMENNNRITFKNNRMTNDYIGELKRRLGNNKLLINYFISSQNLYAFIINRENFKLLEIPIEYNQLKKVTKKYYNTIKNTVNVFQNYNQDEIVAHYDSTIILSKKLYSILLGWPELQKMMHNADVLYIVPDDFLYLIPFSSLVDPKLSETEFLINQNAIVYIPCCSSILLNQTDFVNDDNILNKKILFSIDRRFPNAQNLATLIKQRSPFADELSINYSNAEVNDIVNELNKNYQIYIFLGHSNINTNFPNLTNFALSVNNRAIESEKIVELSLSDIKSLKWPNAEKVFLIGCETAIGKSYKGTGLLSIQQVILSSGVPEIIASTWKINSSDVIPQIEALINSLYTKKDLALILQDIQIGLIKNLENDSYYLRPHPYNWGNFSIYKLTII